MLSVTRLNFVKRLKDKAFRRKFFRTSAQEDVAQQIRDLRHKHGMRQVDLAKAAHMKQSAVSRLEQASYSRWSFATILRISDSLDARVRVIFQPADEVIKEYEDAEKERVILQRQFEEGFREVPVSEHAGQLDLPQRKDLGLPVRRANREDVQLTGDQSSPDRTSTAQAVALPL